MSRLGSNQIMDRIRQDYLGGDLSCKSTTELRELLERQEKLLKKTNFLQSLPDRGKKVQVFAEKLQQLIKERTDHVTISEINPLVVKNPVTQSKKLDNDQTNYKSGRDQYDKFRSIVEEESKSLPRNSINDDTDSNSNSNLYSIPVTRRVTLTELEVQLDKMEISSDKPSKYPAGEHILSVIEKTHNNRKRSPLKLNRDLKISSVEDLPPKFFYPGKKNSAKKITSLWEETAVCPPKYKHSMAQEMSLQESMKLQEEQKKNQEEAQALFAAEKLAARLNIKMETFNPEGKDMSYREPEVIDSDDDPEEVD